MTEKQRTFIIEKSKTYGWYVLFYIIGIMAALLSPLKMIEDGLAIVGPITLTALFASLLVPFAAFSKNERWQKFCMQYVLTALFGMYTVVLREKGAATGFILFACAASVHVAYWMSSIHSRRYRLEQFRLGFEHEMRVTARLVAMLNGQGKSHESDDLITRLLNGERVKTDWLKRILAETCRQEWEERIEKEIRRVSPDECVLHSELETM